MCESGRRETFGEMLNITSVLVYVFFLFFAYLFSSVLFWLCLQLVFCGRQEGCLPLIELLCPLLGIAALITRQSDII